MYTHTVCMFVKYSYNEATMYPSIVYILRTRRTEWSSFRWLTIGWECCIEKVTLRLILPSSCPHAPVPLPNLHLSSHPPPHRNYFHLSIFKCTPEFFRTQRRVLTKSWEFWTEDQETQQCLSLIFAKKINWMLCYSTWGDVLEWFHMILFQCITMQTFIELTKSLVLFCIWNILTKDSNHFYSIVAPFEKL